MRYRCSSRLSVVPFRREEGVADVVVDAAGVVEEHAYGHLAAALAGQQLGHVVAGRPVQVDPALRGLLEDGHGGEGLGDAADAVPEVGADLAPGGGVGEAGGAVEALAAVADPGVDAVHAGLLDRVQPGLQPGPVEAPAGVRAVGAGRFPDGGARGRREACQQGYGDGGGRGGATQSRCGSVCGTDVGHGGSSSVARWGPAILVTPHFSPRPGARPRPPGRTGHQPPEGEAP